MPRTDSTTEPQTTTASPQRIEMALSGDGDFSLQIAINIQSTPGGSTAVASLVEGGSQESKPPGDGRVHYELDK